MGRDVQAAFGRKLRKPGEGTLMLEVDQEQEEEAPDADEDDDEEGRVGGGGGKARGKGSNKKSKQVRFAKHPFAEVEDKLEKSWKLNAITWGA